MTTAPFSTGALRLCGHAAQLLGWRPHEFWEATPAELAAALAPPTGEVQPLSRADLTRLMEQDDA